MTARTANLLHRPDVAEMLDRGDAAIEQAMSEQPLKGVRAGDHIVFEGEPHEGVYRVRSGWLARTRILADGRKQIILIFLPGDICGLKCMYLPRQPDAIEALSDASLGWMDQRALRDLMHDNPDVSIRVLWEALEHERHLHNWVVGLGQAVAVERVGQMLLDFRHRLERRGVSTGDTFHLPLSQQQMAEYLGINVVHLNRTLRRLREAGLVVIEKQTVAIRDLEGLRRIARPLLDLFERG
jgi:CRP-like cAMP-binding protein